MLPMLLYFPATIKQKLCKLKHYNLGITKNTGRVFLLHSFLGEDPFLCPGVMSSPRYSYPAQEALRADGISKMITFQIRSKEDMPKQSQ